MSLESVPSVVRPNCCRKLNFGDEPADTNESNVEMDLENGAVRSPSDLRYTDVVQRILRQDVIEKSDYYNYDFERDRPMPPKSQNSGFQWSYQPSSCQYYFQKPYRKGDSLIPDQRDATSSDTTNSSLVKPTISDDLRTPGKKKPKKKETGVANESTTSD